MRSIKVINCQPVFHRLLTIILRGDLDLNEHLIKHPAATFFLRATGRSMVEADTYEKVPIPRSILLKRI
jgi:hypothetical protein